MSMNFDSPASTSSMQYPSSKQMSISSLTSSPLPTSNNLIAKLPVDISSPPLTQKSPNTLGRPYFMTMPDSPESPSFNEAAVVAPANSYFAPKQPDRHPLSQTADKHERRYHPYYQCDTAATSDAASKRANEYSYSADRSSSISSATSMSVPLLSLKERRQRNKVASAKYRGKKKEEYENMQQQVSALLKDNEVLQRQLDQVRRENNKLKSTCDKLRGKMLAKKMLKEMLQRRGTIDRQRDNDDDDILDNDNDSDNEDNHTESYLYLGRSNGAYCSGNSSPFLKRLYDIDFSDDDDCSSNQPKSNDRTRPF
ncbi:hypothetical protein BD408DRAFT_420145 [Parasitella parasitica]|nr:hypothetical protein BD408DRAFT_420145 [Parasitella parasitica]